MAKRYVYIVDSNNEFQKVEVDFEWFPGFSKVQKQKSVESLHNSFSHYHNQNVLEVSTASTKELGVKLSAFNLKVETKKGYHFTVEQLFQTSKVFKSDGVQTKLLEEGIDSRDVKKRMRELHETDELIGFECFGRVFKLKPETLFYNWLYIQALVKNHELSREILEYDAFSDISFNPKKSINCQAEACAIFVMLKRENNLEEALKSTETFEDIVYNV